MIGYYNKMGIYLKKYSLNNPTLYECCKSNWFHSHWSLSWIIKKILFQIA